MQITRHRPFARGVDQLMYVGDDAGAATAPVHVQVLTTHQLVGVGVAALFAPKGKRIKYASWATAVGVAFNIATGKLAV